MNNKIRFGIVGTGTIAHRFAEAIKNVPQAELVAVASRTKEMPKNSAKNSVFPCVLKATKKWRNPMLLMPLT